MNRFLLHSCLSLILLLPTDLHSQMEGDQWAIGYWSGGNSNYSFMNLDFSTGNLILNWSPDIIFQMSETSSNICDKNGAIILWTNGMQIMGRNGVSIADTIAYDQNQIINYWDYFYYYEQNLPLGFPFHDGAIILPVPGLQNEYSVIYHSAEDDPSGYFLLNKHLEARVKYEDKEDSFLLFYKDRLISPPPQPFSDLWFAYPIEAVRHSNGRDWWIFAFEVNSSKYFVYKLDPLGLNFDHAGNIDMPVKFGIGQATFSNQGDFLARIDPISTFEGQYITLYKVDRCIGSLTRLETIHMDIGYFTGIAFSPSQQFMYADDNTHLWQWDLWSNDISNSRILIDTFDGFVQPGWFSMRFGAMMCAPDNKIYLIPPAASGNYLHVIERPDLPGKECRFLQHVIDLQVPNGRSAPNIPNFRLGPIDGSDCDTLNLDNHPVSWWRYDEDTKGLWQTIRFTDLSYYLPETWHWDFDDGFTSDEQSPVHTFEPGLYHVCQTVSNVFSSDSTCRWIEILNTAIKEEKISACDLSISPNPFIKDLVIHTHSGLFRNIHLELFDLHGRHILNEYNLPVPLAIALPYLAPGMYLCKITEKDGTVFSKKVIKLE